jgi:pantoate--beta-alanine ligase
MYRGGDGGVSATRDLPTVARTREELVHSLAVHQGSAAADAESAVVMTMGALHEGHVELIRTARAKVGAGGHVTVTIFVNPLQFGAGEDFERYPRTFAADLDVCRDEGVDLVFAPDRDEMYPGGPPLVRVDPGPLGVELEGAVRPGHFAGVLTVVAKLLNLTMPNYAIFGEKDYQQLILIQRMVADLEMPYEIVPVAIVRDPDRLATSSRNRYLSEPERKQALALSRALDAGVAAAPAGRDSVLDAARAELTAVAVDYLELRASDLAPAPESGEARLLVAARVGPTRLIDNAPVRL